MERADRDGMGRKREERDWVEGMGKEGEGTGEVGRGGKGRKWSKGKYGVGEEWVRNG